MGNGRFILPIQVFLGLDPERRKSAKERIGVLLQPGDKLDAIIGLLDQLSLVALAFPAFNDGRSFPRQSCCARAIISKAPLRACGQVLIDQLPHMIRVGFDEFEVSHPVLIKPLGKGRGRRPRTLFISRPPRHRPSPENTLAANARQVGLFHPSWLHYAIVPSLLATPPESGPTKWII